jgi:hypothetical protein
MGIPFFVTGLEESGMRRPRQGRKQRPAQPERRRRRRRQNAHVCFCRVKIGCYFNLFIARL